MPDQTLQLLIETIYKGDGTKATLADLRRLVQETNAGSKEAAAALDHWRATYGKLRNEMAAGFGNTGRGLASSPNLPYGGPIPPVIPQAEQSGGAGLSHAMRRHIGAVAGQVLGLPGLGVAVATGGVVGAAAAAVVALEKVLRVVVNIGEAWNKIYQDLAASNRAYDNIAQRIDTIGGLQQKMSIQNQAIALQHAQIERHVNNVATAIAHRMQMDETANAFEERADQARTARLLSEAQLRNRFNPIGLIRETNAIEEQHFARRMQRERELEQSKIRAMELQARNAAAQAAVDQTTSDKFTKSVPQATNIANEIKETSKVTIDAANVRLAKLERLRQITDQLADGVVMPGLGLKEYAAASAAVAATDGPSALDAAVGLHAREVGLGFPGATVQQAAAQRRAELDAAIGQTTRQKKDAEESITAADAATKALQARKDVADKHVEENLKLQKEAEKQARELREKADLEEKFRSEIEGDERARRGARERLELQNIESTGATGGFGAISETNDLLRQILAVWQA